MFSGWGKRFPGSVCFLLYTLVCFFIILCFSASALAVNKNLPLRAADADASTWLSCALGNKPDTQAGQVSSQVICWGADLSQNTATAEGTVIGAKVPNNSTVFNNIGKSNPGFRGLSVGTTTVCAIKTDDNNVVCWDYPVQPGTTGTPDLGSKKTYKKAPYVLTGWSGLPLQAKTVQLSADTNRGCLIDLTDRLVCWGFKDWQWATENGFPRIDTTANTEPVGDKRRPRMISGIQNKSGKKTVINAQTQSASMGAVDAVDVNSSGACVIKQDRSVFCWSDDTKSPIVSVPSGLQATQISLGVSHACAVQSSASLVSGAVVCWGSGSGQDALPTSNVKTNYVCAVNPMQKPDEDTGELVDSGGCRAKNIVSGWRYSCGISSSPEGDTVQCWGMGGARVASRPFADKKASSIFSGKRHICMIAAADGLVSCQPMIVPSGIDWDRVVCKEPCLRGQLSSVSVAIRSLGQPVIDTAKSALPAPVTYNRSASFVIKAPPSGAKVLYNLNGSRTRQGVRQGIIPGGKLQWLPVAKTSGQYKIELKDLPTALPGIDNIQTLTVVIEGSKENRSTPLTYSWNLVTPDYGLKAWARSSSGLSEEMVPANSEELLGTPNSNGGFGSYQPWTNAKPSIIKVNMSLADDNRVYYSWGRDKTSANMVKLDSQYCSREDDQSYEITCAFNAPALASPATGSYKFTLQQRQTTGQIISTDVYDVLIDSQAPQAPLPSSPVVSNDGTLSIRSVDFTLGNKEENGLMDCTLLFTPKEQSEEAKEETKENCRDGSLTLNGLRDGDYVLKAVQWDLAGNRSAESSFKWKVAAPQAPKAIDIPSATKEARPLLSWESPAGTGSKCQLIKIDGGGEVIMNDWAVCSNPYRPLVNLEDGAYRLQVTLTSGMGESLPASFSFMVDTKAPASPTFRCAKKVAGKCLPPAAFKDSLSYEPARAYGAFSQRTAIFSMSNSEPGSSYECKLDGVVLPPVGGRDFCSDYTSLKDKKLYARSKLVPQSGSLSIGRHRFEVVQIDQAGNRSQPAVAVWYTYLNEGSEKNPRWRHGLTAESITGAVFKINGDPTDSSNPNVNSIDIPINLFVGSGYTQSLAERLTLQCRLDSTTWGACPVVGSTSLKASQNNSVLIRYAFSSLDNCSKPGGSPGSHVFAVRVIVAPDPDMPAGKSQVIVGPGEERSLTWNTNCTPPEPPPA